MSYKTPEEAIAAAKPDFDDGYIEFSGNDMCEDCKGWDGNDRRCQCGNRRVAWETYQNEDGSWDAYAEAY